MPKYPHDLPVKFRPHWDAPWERSKQTTGFRSWLDRHGYLTPNFTLRDAACHDGTPIPRSLRSHARTHAFNMERLRHALGDRPIPVLSWYRTPAYNKQTHGAIDSRHIHADATDVDTAWVSKTGRRKVQATAEIIFKDGGVGTYPAGSMHFDSRGYKARWTSFVGW